MKAFIWFNLILVVFSLKETIYTYKAMTELKNPLKIDACKFVNNEEDVIYVKPCEKGYHCGNEINGIGICIKNNILKKLGEVCNYDNECLAGHCEKNKCSFNEKDKAFLVEKEGIYRCGNDLFYLNEEKSCKNELNFDYLKNYCTYLKKKEDSKVVNIEPNQPFYMCGESGFATEDQTELKLNSYFIKASKIGELKNGIQSEHEYTCETGFRSVYNDNLICDNVEKIIRKGINEEGFAYAEYVFEKAGHYNITEEIYDAGFFYRNYFTGDLEPYDEIYIKAFREYVSALKKYEKYCNPKSHNYYFNPLHCGIKQIYDAYFYLNHMSLYQNKTKEAQMIIDFFKRQEQRYQEFEAVDEKNNSNSLILKVSFLGLITILSLF